MISMGFQLDTFITLQLLRIYDNPIALFSLMLSASMRFIVDVVKYKVGGLNSDWPIDHEACIMVSSTWSIKRWLTYRETAACNDRHCLK